MQKTSTNFWTCFKLYYLILLILLTGEPDLIVFFKVNSFKKPVAEFDCWKIKEWKDNDIKHHAIR